MKRMCTLTLLKLIDHTGTQQRTLLQKCLLTDQLYHIQTSIQIKLFVLCLNLEKKISGSCLSKEHLETEMHTELHILTVHENYFCKNQTESSHYMNTVTKCISDVETILNTP